MHMNFPIQILKANLETQKRFLGRFMALRQQSSPSRVTGYDKKIASCQSQLDELEEAIAILEAVSLSGIKVISYSV